MSCEVYVIKTFRFLDDASGSIFAHHSPIHNKELEKYAASLPQYAMEINGEPYPDKENPVMMQPDIDQLVNAAADQLEQERINKRLSKKMLTCFLIGNKQTGTYREINFKRPLSDVPTTILQEYYTRYKNQLKAGDSFWNTNLTQLGINI